MLALVIEDDVDLAIIFARAVEAAQFTVLSFATAEAAWEQMAQTVPHLVVLDLNLPGRSGSSLLADIRADGRFARTQVILATADHLLAHSLEEVADLVLVKPITFSQLRDLSFRLRETLLA